MERWEKGRSGESKIDSRFEVPDSLFTGGFGTSNFEDSPGGLPRVQTKARCTLTNYG